MERSKAEARIRELRGIIEHHMDLYYNQDAPEITDFAYDRLMQQLKALEKEYPDLVTPDSPTQKVGGTVKREAGVTVTHRVPMLSIQDVFSKEEVHAWMTEVLAMHPDARFSVEEKIDGLSMTLRYENGNLALAETRGDGLVGEDVTLNAKAIPDVPLKIPLTGYLEVRGEVYMSHEKFDAFNAQQTELGKKPAANPRNLAAGTLRQLDAEVTRQRGLKLFLFNVQDASEENHSFLVRHTEAMDQLETLGMKTVRHTLCTTPEQVLEEIDRIGESRGTLDYDIDGAVVKIDQIAYRGDFPAGSKYSAGHIAYKYPPEEKEVTIESIEVDVGRTGKLTFRALFREPVRLCGTSVQRATLHNIDYIHSLGIDEGCRAICRKQGEIIPAIISVTHSTGTEYQPPAVCPVCGHTLVREADTADIYCENPSCPAQLKRTVAYFAGRDAMDIKSFGQTYVNTLTDLGYLTSYADIYHLKDHREELIDRGIMGREKNTDKILAAIEASKQNDAARLLTGLAIRNVGRTSAREIMKHFSDIRALSEASVEELTMIPDVGQITAQAIYDFFHEKDNLQILRDLEESGVNMQSEQHAAAADELEGLTIVVTGTLPTLGRKEAQQLIESHGGRCTGSVSKKTDYLLAGEAAGSKLEKAKSLGVPIINEQELLEMIRKPR